MALKIVGLLKASLQHLTETLRNSLTKNSELSAASTWAEEYQQLHDMRHSRAHQLYGTDPEPTHKCFAGVVFASRNANHTGTQFPRLDIVPERGFVQMSMQNKIKMVAIIEGTKIVRVQEYLEPLLKPYSVCYSSTLDHFHNCAFIDVRPPYSSLAITEELRAQLLHDASLAGAHSLTVHHKPRNVVQFSCGIFALPEVAGMLQYLGYEILHTHYKFRAKDPVELSNIEERIYGLFVQSCLDLPGLFGFHDNLQNTLKLNTQQQNIKNHMDKYI